MQENFMEEVRGATNSPNNTKEFRAERIVEKTEDFMIQILNDLRYRRRLIGQTIQI